MLRGTWQHRPPFDQLRGSSLIARADATNQEEQPFPGRAATAGAGPLARRIAGTKPWARCPDAVVMVGTRPACRGASWNRRHLRIGVVPADQAGSWRAARSALRPAAWRERRSVTTSRGTPTITGITSSHRSRLPAVDAGPDEYGSRLPPSAYRWPEMRGARPTLPPFALRGR